MTSSEKFSIAWKARGTVGQHLADRTETEIRLRAVDALPFTLLDELIRITEQLIRSIRT